MVKQPDTTAPPAEQLLKAADVIKTIGVNRVTLWRLRKEHDFPKGFVLGGRRTVRWRASDIAEWIASRERA